MRLIFALILLASPVVADVRCVQEHLTTIGYDPGPIDGVLGPRTVQSLANFSINYRAHFSRLTTQNAGTACARLTHYVDGAGGQQLDPAQTVQGAEEPFCATNPADGFAMEITELVEGDPLTLRVSSRFGGAVESVVWRGKEFINIYDHGRQISYAWTLNDVGECLNPTEPGSAWDFLSQTSTTAVHSICSDATNRLTTHVTPAYWLAPGGTGYCDGGHVLAVNDSPLSDHDFIKTIELGYAGIENVIAFDISLTLPRDYDVNMLEMPTGYMTHEFTEFWRFDPSTGELTKPESELLAEPWSFVHRSSIPPIISTPDGEYAMGAYSAEEIAGYELLGYDVHNPADRTNKWNVVLREVPAPAGEYTYKSFAIVGTLAEVQVAMRELFLLHPRDPTPPDGFVDVANCTMIDGWVWDTTRPNEPLTVEIYQLHDDGSEALVHAVNANQFRQDLADVSVGDGYHAFSIPTATLFPDGGDITIRVEGVSDIEGIPNTLMKPAVHQLSCP